jgi:hypothetical protein
MPIAGSVPTRQRPANTNDTVPDQAPSHEAPEIRSQTPRPRPLSVIRSDCIFPLPAVHLAPLRSPLFPGYLRHPPLIGNPCQPTAMELAQASNQFFAAVFDARLSNLF